MKTTTKLLFGILIGIILVYGCTPEPTIVDITNNITGVNKIGPIFLEGEGTIPLELCKERGLNDEIIILESRYCGACRIVVPRLKEIGEELQEEFIFLDLSKKGDLRKMKEFKIIPMYTPTVLIGCDVYIGAYPKEKYKQPIEKLLSSK